jgi:diguanylate cyclase (GGDEF)-like protein
MATQAATRFAAIRDLPYFLPQERDHLRAAEKEWQRVLVVAERLLAGPGRPDPAGLGELRQVAAGLLVIEEELQNLLALADLEIAEMRAEVGRVNRESQLLLAGVFLLGILTALVSGGVLARSVLRPLRELERGTQEFAAGRLGHRLAEGRKDELGGLMLAFNAMAERLERQQKVLKQISVRDSLTGLVNHREFYRHLHQELLRSRRYGHPLALLMVDLDHFKDVNDLFGHPAGDRVLRVVARVLRRQLRTSDLVGRYGGEEFSIILPETRGIKAFELADRIRQALAREAFDLGEDHQVRLTVSIGMATFPTDAEQVENLVKVADDALYAVKKAGRNRVCWRGRFAGPG